MNELIKWISISDRFNKMHLNSRFEQLGINSSQHMYILRICEQEGITQDTLQTLVYTNKSNVTRALVQLENAGFITKEPNKKDRRTVRLFPTAKAKAIYQQIIDIEEQWIARITCGLSPEEATQLVKLMKKVGEVVISYINVEDHQSV